MAVYEVCYCTREEVRRALDLKESARNTLQIDRAIQSSARSVEGRLRRKFYPVDDTRYFDWPNYDYSYPWRLELLDNELAGPATQVLAGTTPIPINQIFFGPWRNDPGPPFTFFELDRSQSAAFGGNAPTPQRSIVVSGPFGFDLNKDPVTTLSAAISTAGATVITVADGSQVGAGAILVVDTERMLVQDTAMTSTGLTVSSGLASSPPLASDAALTASGSTLNVNETILVDAERMLIVDSNGSTGYTVKRGWDGTPMATHAPGATIYALRSLTVQRGALGTTAATHGNGVTVNRHRVPSLVKSVSIADAERQLIGEPSGYANVGGNSPVRQDSESRRSGLAQITDLAQLWLDCERRYRRNARIRAI